MPSSQIAPVSASTQDPVTHVLPKTVTLSSARYAKNEQRIAGFDTSVRSSIFHTKRTAVG